MTKHYGVHLLVATTPARRKAACGMVDPRRGTRNPASVTCGICRKTLYMADVEVKNRLKRRG